MATLTRILVPVDFARPSRAALEHALMLAERFAVPVDILHVVSEPPSYIGPDVMVDITGETRLTLTDYARSQADKEMKAFLDAIEAPKSVTVSSRTEFGSPVDVIVQVAAETRADMIVMGRYGTAGIADLLLGSVAEKLVRRAPCAVLTVREHAGDA